MSRSQSARGDARRGVQRPPPPLTGRQDDIRALDEVVRSVRERLSGVLVLVGEPGIGKTRLLQYGLDSAADLQTTSIAGVESEVRMDFAALHRLLLPFLDRADRLPGAQRDALGAAFRLVPETPADRFVVGLAALGLLAEVAAERAVICMVDDAQWVDRESLDVLGFVGRRLHADGIGLLFAVRDAAPIGLPALEGLPVRRLAGLDPAAAGELLASHVPGRLDPQVAHRIVAETGGNPFALLEVAGALTREQLAGTALLPAQLPVGRRLEEHFLRQVRVLPPATRLLLLLASAYPVGDPAVLWRAGALLELMPDAADPALAEGILSSGWSLTFRHPLIRSAVYEAASPAERRRVHAALAAVLDPRLDPDRSAWHRAEGTWAPDEQVAAELERSAERAGRRGGYSGQAAFLSRAAELTPGTAARTRRFLAAAQAHLFAGDPVQAQAMLERAAPGPSDAVARRLGVRIEMFYGRLASVPSTLLQAVEEMDPPDPALAREMLADALTTALVTREHTAGTTVTDVARRALAVPAGTDGSVRDLFREAFATRVTLGYEAAVPLLRAAIGSLRGAGEIREGGSALTLLGGLATEDLWDDDGRWALLARMDSFLRERGALRELADALEVRAVGEVWAGRFGAAAASAAEAAEIGRAMGLAEQGFGPRVELLAWQGRDAEARGVADVLERVLGQQGKLALLAVAARCALTVLDLGRGRYADALALARRVAADDPPGQGSRVLPDLVEAAVRADDGEAAAEALARLSARVTASGTPWALGMLARSRALVAADHSADALYREALAQLRLTSIATELARTHLLYGEWLRRQQRRGDAREQLRTAYDRFVTMGATGFAERARTELLATGERVPNRRAGADHGLTPQETQVARLAAAGSTNSEIAARLFITPSTVEYHLAKVFRKLDIRSRRQLAGVVPG